MVGVDTSASTEHGTGPLLQSTAGANIIFINIDWKRSRHDNPASARRNLTKLANTTSSIVTNMKPAVICCCEAGQVMSPMTGSRCLRWRTQCAKHGRRLLQSTPRYHFSSRMMRLTSRYGMTTAANARTGGFCKMYTMCQDIGVWHKPSYAPFLERAMRKASTSLTYMLHPVTRS